VTSARREYPARPIVGIGVCLLKPGHVLLVRRGNPPNLGAWSLPGGAQELGETAESAARRELLEETGIVARELVLAANVDSIHHDEDGRVRYHYTIIDFAGHWAEGEPVPGGDVAATTWASLHRLDEFDLWQEAHRVIAISRSLLSI
jgi:8-oxo-dGTP diphosphatase